MPLTTHVTDCAHGQPAAGVTVRLERRVDDDWAPRAVGATAGDGRVIDWSPEPLSRLDRGVYRLVFDSGGYFAALGIAPFHPEVVVVFAVADPDADYHVPLLLAPHGFATFRGNR
jgi:5-hydroxyisourate hydrolase